MTYISPSSVNASRGLSEVLTYVNVCTSGWFSNMIMIAIYVIILLGYAKAREDFKGAFAIAGYGTFVVGLLFWVGGFISGIAFGFAIGGAILGTIILLLDNN